MTDKELLVEMLEFVYRVAGNTCCPVCYDAWKYHTDEKCLINRVAKTTGLDAESLARKIEYEDCD
jgi:hypothetical protein